MNNIVTTTEYSVSFTALLERYEITQSNLSHRIKKLGLKTEKRGRKTFLTLNQLSLLDYLNRFLKQNPSHTIDEFLALNRSRSDELLINSSTNHQSINNTSMTHQSINDASMISKSAFIEKENEAKALLQQVNELERQLETERQAKQKKDTMITQLCNKIEELKDELQVQDEVQDESYSIENPQNQLEDLRAKVEFLTKKLKAQKQDVKKSQHQVDSLHLAVQEYIQNKEELEAKLNKWHSLFYLPFRSEDVQICKLENEQSYHIWVRARILPPSSHPFHSAENLLNGYLK